MTRNQNHGIQIECTDKPEAELQSIFWYVVIISVYTFYTLNHGNLQETTLTNQFQQKYSPIIGSDLDSIYPGQ